MNELATLIDTLSEKLGVAASELYSVMQTQARLYIIKGPVWCIFYIGAIIFTCVFLKKVFIDKTQTIHVGYRMETAKKVSIFKYHEEECDEGRMFFYGTLAVFLLIVSVICSFEIIATFDDIVTCIFNPKFWALDHILSYLK